VSYKDGYHEAIPYTPQQGYYHELCNFYNALRHGEAIQSTPEKALGDIEVIFALLKSADYNEPVKVSKAKITNQKRIKAS
jgi:predicted dehydrogenase